MASWHGAFFGRQQQSDLPADQGPPLWEVGSQPMQGTRFLLHPTCMSEFGYTTPNTKARVPGWSTGICQQRITRICRFLSNSMVSSTYTRAWNQSHPCPPAGLGLRTGYHLDCPSRQICLLVRLPEDVRSPRALLAIRGTASESLPVVARTPSGSWVPGRRSPYFLRHGLPKMPGHHRVPYPPAKVPGASGPRPGRAASLGVLADEITSRPPEHDCARNAPL